MTAQLAIIIPVLDEAAGLASKLAALAQLRASGACVIVVDGGSSDATVASVDEGSPIALIPMMNEPTIKIVSGVIVLWRSSCRVTIDPATAKSPA